MFETKKRFSFLKLAIILLFASLLGVFLGYISVRSRGFHNNKGISYPKEEKITNEEVTVLPEYVPLPANTAPTDSEAEDAINLPPEDTDYIVKVNENKVCLFKRNESGVYVPETELPINLNALKEDDRNLFKKGIPVKTKQELASVLEDFGS